LRQSYPIQLRAQLACSSEMRANKVSSGSRAALALVFIGAAALKLSSQPGFALDHTEPMRPVVDLVRETVPTGRSSRAETPVSHSRGMNRPPLMAISLFLTPGMKWPVGSNLWATVAIEAANQ
jgi:hypothetical protein